MMAKHLSWLTPDTCGCQVVRWFDDELPNDLKVFSSERMGEIRSGVRLTVPLVDGDTTVHIDGQPQRPIVPDDVLKIDGEFLRVTATTSNTLTVARGHEGTTQGQRRSHPTRVHEFFYIPHPIRSNVLVRRPCDVHAAITDSAVLHDAVTEENNRKNVAVGLIGTLATMDRVELWAVIAKPDKGDGKGGWRFDASTPRVVIFNFAGVLPQPELSAMDDAASLQFGPGLVTLERA